MKLQSQFCLFSSQMQRLTDSSDALHSRLGFNRSSSRVDSDSSDAVSQGLTYRQRGRKFVCVCVLVIIFWGEGEGWEGKLATKIECGL